MFYCLGFTVLHSDEGREKTHANLLVHLTLDNDSLVLELALLSNLPLWVIVSMLTHIYPHKARRKIEVIICKITRLTAHFMCGLMSDLLICTCL